MAKEIAPDLLRVMIRNRRRMVIKTVSFVTQLVQKCGKVTEHYEASSYTHTVRELTVRKFHLKTDFGQSMMGGNDVKVSYNGRLVFAVYNQSFDFGDEVAVNAWDEKGLRPFRRFMAAGLRKAKKEAEARQAPRPKKSEVAAAARRKKLKEDAQRLRIF